MKKVRDLLAGYSLQGAWRGITRPTASWLGTRDGRLPLTVPVRLHARVAASPQKSRQPVHQSVSSLNMEDELRADKGIVLRVKPLLSHSAKYSDSGDDFIYVVNNCGSIQSCECRGRSFSGLNSFDSNLNLKIA